MDEEGETPAWTCAKCRTRIPLGADLDEEKVKAEHGDYHLALELAREHREPVTPKKRKIKGGKNDGILAFFKPSPK